MNFGPKSHSGSDDYSLPQPGAIGTPDSSAICRSFEPGGEHADRAMAAGFACGRPQAPRLSQIFVLAEIRVGTGGRSL